ncbi:MAG: diaminopimelate decarboxylase [Lachnospiraceae bacterium]|nr:diaminopimelate decarboxylase [Lachnospiraceae bacterium]
MAKTVPFTLADAREWKNQFPTPFYILDEEGIRQTVTDINTAFSWNEGFCEHFAVKANPNPSVLRLLASLGCGTDCASIAELEMSRRCGMTGHKIILTSNETSDACYQKAKEVGAIINLDDITQIDHMERAVGIPDTVCCRFNPGSFGISNAIMGNLYDSKFGMTEEQLFEAFRILKAKGVEHFGIHAMLASCSLDETYYPALAEKLFDLVLRMREENDITVEFVDFAGGVGIPYRPEEKKVDILKVGAEVKKVYDRLLTANGIQLRIMTEMGRFVTGPHGYLVTTCVGKKHIYREYIGVDANAANLMRPAIYGSYHHVTVLGKENEAPCQIVDVVGCLCENNDKFAVQRELPAIDEGDILVIHDGGAHGYSMGYNYNGSLRCAELMMHADKTVTLVRRAETLEDYFATFDIDPVFSKKE